MKGDTSGSKVPAATSGATVSLDWEHGTAQVRLSSAGIVALHLGPGPRAPNADKALLTLPPRERTWLALTAAALAGEAQQRPPLDLHGTAFQREIWGLIAAIPAGATMTYRELALAAGRPQAARAVAQACAANPVAVLIPCHRVVRSDGGLGGYRWGFALKQALLAREGSDSASSHRKTRSS